MSGDPYDFETIGREPCNDDCTVGVQAELWRDSDGHYVHTVLAIWDDSSGESFTLPIEDAAAARRLKNLLAKVERRLP